MMLFAVRVFNIGISFSSLQIFFLFNGLSFKTREQNTANLWDSFLVDELKSLVDCVWAYDSAFASVEHDSAHARLSAFGLFVFGEEFLIFDYELERHISIFEDQDFLLHHLFVFFNCLISDFIHKA